MQVAEQMAVAVASVVMVSALILWARVAIGGQKSDIWVRWEVTRQMLASSLASGSALAWIGTIGSGDPVLNQPEFLAVLVTSTIASTAWWVVESQGSTSKVVWSRRWPRPSEEAAAPDPGWVVSAKTWTARPTRQRERLERLDLVHRLSVRHIIFGGIVLSVIGILLAVIPVEGCQSVAWHLREGYFQGGRCGDSVRARTRISMPMVALGAVACAGALLLPGSGKR